MPRLLKRPQAEIDLNDIWWHIASPSFSLNELPPDIHRQLAKTRAPLR